MPVTVFFGGIEPGSQTFNTVGTHSFTVPRYAQLTVEVWGGGAAGGSARTDGIENANDVAAGNSSFNGTVIGNGGDYLLASAAAASGGDINESGEAPVLDSGRGRNAGGLAYGGGVGPAGPTGVGVGAAGVTPGSGGAGGRTASKVGRGGGGGGFARKTYSAGALTVGASISVVVGRGGFPGMTGAAGTVQQGGEGAIGEVRITWR